MNKQQLVNSLLGLMNGSIAPSDLKPKQLTIAIGYGKDNIYKIDGAAVSKEAFDLQSSKQECTGFAVSYGGMYE